MILSNVPLSYRGLVATLAALFGALCVVGRSPAVEPSGNHRIPAGALGYIHVNVGELDESPLFETLSRLNSRVQTEASAFSLSRLGLDLTTLSEVTFLFPSFDTCMRLQGENQPPFVLIATLSEAFQPETFASRMSAELKLTRDADNVLTNGRDKAFFVASDQTIVVGSPSSVDWWLSTRNGRESSRLAASRGAVAGQGQIAAGLDVTQVPSHFLSQLPSPIQSLSKAGALAVAIRLDDGLSIKTCAAFDTEDGARDCSQELRSLVEQGSAYLSVAEAQMKLGLKSPDATTEQALGVLMLLALTREGAAYLDQVQIEQAGGRVYADARLETSTSCLVMLALTGIRSIAKSGDPKFEAGVQELYAQ
jgi:hypothetical protein